MKPEYDAGELSDEAKLRLLRVFDRIDGWRRRTQVRPPKVCVGSSLIKDDAVTSPYLVSDAVAEHW